MVYQLSIAAKQITSKIWWLKTTHIYNLTISVGQEFSTSLNGWFWLKVSHEVVVKSLAGAAVI